MIHFMLKLQNRSRPNRRRVMLAGVVVVFIFLQILSGLSNSSSIYAQAEEEKNSFVDDRGAFDLSTVKKVAVIPIEGMIDEVADAFVRRSVEQAKEWGADFLVFEMHTWGGRVDSAQGICKSINSFDPLPSAMLVTQSAISAGALIALSNNFIFMSKESTLGDAQPVVGDAPSSEEKHVSFVRAEFRAQAKANGYNPFMAMKMVDANIILWDVTVMGQDRIIDDAEMGQLESSMRTDSEGVRVNNKYMDAGQLLVLDAQEALETGFVQGLASSRQEMYAALGISNPDELQLSMTWSENFAKWLTNPWLTALLMTVGMIGLYIEFQHPGVGLPGGAAVTCFAIVFFGKYVAGLATILELLMLLIGLGLIIAEIFFIPGFGVAGLLGAFLAGSALLLSMQNFVWPSNPVEMDLFSGNVLMTLSVLTVSLVGVMILMRNAQHIPGMQRLFLFNDVKSSDGFIAVQDMSEWVDQKGVAETTLRPSGKVRIQDTLIDAVTRGNMIDAGTPVIVRKVEGNRVVVSKIEE